MIGPGAWASDFTLTGSQASLLVLQEAIQSKPCQAFRKGKRQADDGATDRNGCWWSHSHVVVLCFLFPQSIKVKLMFAVFFFTVGWMAWALLAPAYKNRGLGTTVCWMNNLGLVSKKITWASGPRSIESKTRCVGGEVTAAGCFVL